MSTPDDPEHDERWRRALEGPFAVVRAAAGDLAAAGWVPDDATGARVLERLAAAPAADVLLDAVRREVPVATRVGDELPAGPAALAPDGRHVAVLAGAERVEVRDRERGALVWSRELPGLGGGRVLAARGARCVVVASARGSSVDLLTVQANGTATVGSLTDAPVGLGVWEPDRLVSVADDGTVTVWSLADGPARRMTASSATPVTEGVVEPDRERVVLTHRDGTRQVLDLVTGEVTEVAPGTDGVTPGGGPVRVAADPAGRLRASAGSGELGVVDCPVRQGTRLVAAPDVPLVVVADVDARAPTTVWSTRGAMLHEALARPLLDATPDQLAVLDEGATGDLSDDARRCLALVREVLEVRLRDAVEVTVETVVAAGAPAARAAVAASPATASRGADGPGPRDVEIEIEVAPAGPERGSDPDPDPADPAGPAEEPEGPVPAVLSSIRTTSWWG